MSYLPFATEECQNLRRIKISEVDETQATYHWMNYTWYSHIARKLALDTVLCTQRFDITIKTSKTVKKLINNFWLMGTHILDMYYLMCLSSLVIIMYLSSRTQRLHITG